MHALPTRTEDLPLDGAVAAGAVFALRIQEDVLVDPPAQAEHVRGRAVTALQNLEHDLQSLLTVAGTVSPERVVWKHGSGLKQDVGAHVRSFWQGLV